MAAQENNTLFGKILSGKIATEFVYEDEFCVAFKDINPQAPVHLLVIPRAYIPSISAATPDQTLILGQLMQAAKNVASSVGLDEGGYRLVINNGPAAGQSVYHLHVHILGGRNLSWPPG